MFLFYCSLLFICCSFITNVVYQLFVCLSLVLNFFFRYLFYEIIFLCFWKNVLGEGIQTESCVTASEYVKVLALARKDWLVIMENMDVKIECGNENESKNEINKMLKSSGVAVHVEE